MLRNTLKKYMRSNPFITSLVLFLICNLLLYLIFCFLAFIAAPLFNLSGASVNAAGIPVSGIIAGSLWIIAIGVCDVYFAIKAESRLGYLIWLLGIPLFIGLFSATPENDFMMGSAAMWVTSMYFYRVLVFSLVRTYSYLARDERRKREKAELEASGGIGTGGDNQLESGS